ncbi:MAG: 16S rRNA (guanine(966)-N(2))-methyltransferase RsmD [Firmicutes bacterium]|nr:16S rRNA (guanine(966)-N(2))-methyltransferase RsmD [Bacillota bacterium]
MRIIAGLAKGRRLIAPPGIHTRPTASRVREALFSVIMMRLPGAKVLDAFAGSGALGLEALSRGAATSLFIENDKAALKALRHNVANCRLAGAEIFFGDAIRFLRQMPQSYEIIFLDPPYGGTIMTQAIMAVLEGGALESGGLIIAETAAKEEVYLPDGFSILKHSVYGDTALYYLEH